MSIHDEREPITSEVKKCKMFLSALSSLLHEYNVEIYSSYDHNNRLEVTVISLPGTRSIEFVEDYINSKSASEMIAKVI